MAGSEREKNSLEALIHSFRNGTRQERFQAIARLAECPFEDTKEVLFEALKDNNHRIRSTAAKIIGKRGDETVIAPILHFLYNDSWIVRASAQEALSYLPPSIAFPAFRGMLTSSEGDPNLRKNIAAVLARYDSQEATELLIQIFQNADDSDLKAQITEYLSRKVDESAINTLFDALRDESWNVRTAALKALKSMDISSIIDPAIEALGNTDRLIHMAAVELLISFGNEEVIDAMTDVLSEKNPLKKINALNVLSGVQSEESLMMMVTALGDTNAAVRNRAVDALSAHKTPAVFKLLKRCLKSTNWSLKQGAVTTLGKLRSEESIDLLQDLLDESNTALKVLVLETLASISGRRCLRIITQHLHDEDLGEEGIRIVKGMDPDLAIGHLISFFADDMLLDPAVDALRSFDRGKVLRIMASKMATGTRDQKMSIITAMGRLGGSQAKSYLTQMMEIETAHEVKACLNDTIKLIDRKLT